MDEVYMYFSLRYTCPDAPFITGETMPCARARDAPLLWPGVRKKAGKVIPLLYGIIPVYIVCQDPY
jgi:hypothetical protein